MNDEERIRLELIKEALQKNRAVCINDGVPVAKSPTLMTAVEIAKWEEWKEMHWKMGIDI